MTYADSDESDDLSCIIHIEESTPTEHIIAVGSSDVTTIMSDSGSSIDLANTSLLQNVQQSSPFWVYDFHNSKTSIDSSGQLVIYGYIRSTSAG